MKIARAQMEALETVIKGLQSKEQHAKLVKQLVALRDRLAKQDKPKQQAGIGVGKAIAAMREVGPTISFPPSPTADWLARHAARIRDLGLTEDSCQAMVRAMSNRGWAPPFSFEYIIKAADRLLAESSMPAQIRGQKSTAPVGMDD